jgi:hypothetical protein
MNTRHTSLEAQVSQATRLSDGIAITGPSATETRLSSALKRIEDLERMLAERNSQLDEILFLYKKIDNG